VQCIRPYKAGFTSDYKLTLSKKQADKQFATFDFQCRKCLPCRLNQAREKAIRAYHEYKIQDKGIFLTLTYDNDHLESPYLIYEHFQSFMKRLRSWIYYNESHDLKIDRMVTGEYGDENKRPHWHALIFGWEPDDKKIKLQNDRGDTTYTSSIIASLWDKGSHDFGSITLDSASYVARYAAKKLAHGNDEEHKYQPIHKTPNRRGLGRSWIEKNYKHALQNGFIILPNGQKSQIPRYYIDWAKTHVPDLYEYYVTHVRPTIHEQIQKKQRKEEMDWISDLFSTQQGSPRPLTRSKVKETILKQKFKRLQERTKL